MRTRTDQIHLAAQNVDQLRQLIEQHIAYYALRSVVRPGMTGWAQIRYGYANNLEEETEKMRYDLYYIKHLSLGLDARILLETARHRPARPRGEPSPI